MKKRVLAIVAASPPIGEDGIARGQVGISAVIATPLH